MTDDSVTHLSIIHTLNNNVHIKQGDSKLGDSKHDSKQGDIV